MKQSLLARAMSVAFASIALAACGSSDDDIQVVSPAPTPTPTTTAPTTDASADKLASIIANATAMGLSEENAKKFAESVKDLDIGTDSYNTALAAALATQQAEIDNATKPASQTVRNHNPFIHGVDATKQLTSGASFYTRQPGSTYDFGGNAAGDPAGLGGVAIDDPTGDGGNPYLSNYVLGVETINKEVKVVNSTGEFAQQDGANKAGTKIDPIESPYAKNNGLRYNTTRGDGGRLPTDKVHGYPGGFPLGSPNDPWGMGRQNGLVQDQGLGNETRASGYNKDFAYDYTAVRQAPSRNTSWEKSPDIKYTHGLDTWGEHHWNAWARGIPVGYDTDDIKQRWCSNITGPCVDAYAYHYLTSLKTAPTTKHKTQGDFDPWRDGPQTLYGRSHAEEGVGTCGRREDGTYTVTGDRTDCHWANAGDLRQPITQTINGTSAYWGGKRIYRIHHGDGDTVAHANNLVDEREDNRLNAEYGNADDATLTLDDAILNSTVDIVGQPYNNTLYNQGILDGHGSTYGSNKTQNANLEDAFGRKVYTIQEMNRRKVKVSEEAVTDAKAFATTLENTAFNALSTDTSSQGINANDMKNDAHLLVNADPYYTIRKINGDSGSAHQADIEKQRRYDTGLIVYTPQSKRVEGADAKYGYKKPVFGIEENVYVTDETGNNLKVVNHIYDNTLQPLVDDSVEDPTRINNDKNSFFAVAKEKVMVYHQPCRGNVTGADGCRPYEREGEDFADGGSVATTYGLGNNAWWEGAGDIRKYQREWGGTEGLDVVNSTGNGCAGGIPHVSKVAHCGPNEFRAGNTIPSLVKVAGPTWKRMGPWERLTVLRESRNPLETGVDANKVANNLETRVYGKNYRDLEAGAEGFQDTNNSYVGKLKAVKNDKGEVTAHKMANISPTALHHVQYGRLTNNIDILKDNELKGDKKRIIYRQFQEHGAANSVDTYFYRGTNRTTMEQMDALKARGGVIQYYGHALTYNLGPKVQTKDNTLPTAYGSSQESTIGNFVQAKFDTAQGKVDGSIYNFINKDVSNKPEDFFRQDLVTFQGDVYGNTVTGTATKLGINPEQGTLTASFYGTAANELGGAVNSLTREQGYGEPKWGAVFGATRGTMVEQFNVIETNNTQP